MALFGDPVRNAGGNNPAKAAKAVARHGDDLLVLTAAISNPHLDAGAAATVLGPVGVDKVIATMAATGASAGTGVALWITNTGLTGTGTVADRAARAADLLALGWRVNLLTVFADQRDPDWLLAVKPRHTTTGTAKIADAVEAATEVLASRMGQASNTEALTRLAVDASAAGAKGVAGTLGSALTTVTGEPGKDADAIIGLIQAGHTDPVALIHPWIDAHGATISAAVRGNGTPTRRLRLDTKADASPAADAARALIAAAPPAWVNILYGPRSLTRQTDTAAGRTIQHTGVVAAWRILFRAWAANVLLETAPETFADLVIAKANDGGTLYTVNMTQDPDRDPNRFALPQPTRTVCEPDLGAFADALEDARARKSGLAELGADQTRTRDALVRLATWTQAGQHDQPVNATLSGAISENAPMTVAIAVFSALSGKGLDMLDPELASYSYPDSTQTWTNWSEVFAGALRGMTWYSQPEHAIVGLRYGLQAVPTTMVAKVMTWANTSTDPTRALGIVLRDGVPAWLTHQVDTQVYTALDTYPPPTHLLEAIGWWCADGALRYTAVKHPHLTARAADGLLQGDFGYDYTSHMSRDLLGDRYEQQTNGVLRLNPDRLAGAVATGNTDVFLALLANEALDLDRGLLGKIARSKDEKVMTALLYRPGYKAPASLLARASVSPDPALRALAAANPGLRGETKDALAVDPALEVQTAIVATWDPREVPETAWDAVADAPQDPIPPLDREYGEQTPLHTVMSYWVDHPDTPAGKPRDIASVPETFLDDAAAGGAMYPNEVAWGMVRGDHDVHRHVDLAMAITTRLSPEQLVELNDQLQALWSTSTVPAALWAYLAERGALTFLPGTLDVKDWDDDVAAAVASAPGLDPQTRARLAKALSVAHVKALTVLAGDPDVGVRMAVSSRPKSKLPAAVAQVLAGDVAPAVAKAAAKHLPGRNTGKSA